MWPSPKWRLKWQHALLSVAAGAVIGSACAHLVEHCGWDRVCPYNYLYFVGLFVGITAFLAGLLGFVLIAIKFAITKVWASLRS